MLVVLMTACQSRPKDVRQVDELPAIWPDYTAVTVPATIAPLNFAMADDAVETIDVTVTWPRPSYDGRYIMYTQTEYGYFSVWHPEADLWLLDLKTGERRAMDEVNSPRAESLHNWTPNSRWFLFASRRIEPHPHEVARQIKSDKRVH